MALPILWKTLLPTPGKGGWRLSSGSAAVPLCLRQQEVYRGYSVLRNAEVRLKSIGKASLNYGLWSFGNPF